MSGGEEGGDFEPFVLDRSGSDDFLGPSLFISQMTRGVGLSGGM